MNYQQYLLDPMDCDQDWYNEFTSNNHIQQYELPEPPPMWSICPIHMAVETPMHLQMNYIHYNMNFMMNWAKSISKGSYLIRESIVYLSKAKSTNINGFKVITFTTDKFGGYVAENWRCLAQLSPWCFQFIDDQIMNQNIYLNLPDPNNVMFSSWTLSQLRAWLLLRNQELERKVSKKELIVMAKQHFEYEKENIGVIIQPPRILESGQIRDLHRLCRNYCNSLMSIDLNSVQAENRCISYAMAYLSLADKCYRIIHKTDEYKGWSTTYTLLGILRAPTHFRDYTHVRSLYEGGDLGEGIVKHLRVFSPTGIHEGWAKNVLLNYYRKDLMKILNDECMKTKQDDLSIPYEARIDHKSFIRYGSKFDIRQKINNGEVISSLFYLDGNTHCTIIGCMILQVQVWYLCVIHIPDPLDYFIDEFGFTYFQIELCEDEYVIENRYDKNVLNSNIKLWKQGLILPSCRFQPNQYYFCLITDDGYTLTERLHWKHTI